MNHFMKSSYILTMMRRIHVMINLNLKLLITLKAQRIGRKSMMVVAKSTGSASMV